MLVASVEKVVSTRKHPNADLLQIATVLGWDVVCKKEDCKEGDSIVFINIDSVVDPHPYFQFLQSKSYRIRPIKIRGELSQGLIIPLKHLSEFNFENIQDLSVGDDVSSIVCAKHYEKKEPSKNIGYHKSSFPKFLIRTDEYNLRNYPNSVSEIYDKQIYITQKIDGTSATYFCKSGLFGVCSRGLELTPDENPYWSIAKKHDLAYKMLNIEIDFAIQGEIHGPNIQNNPMQIKEIAFSAFNVFFIKDSRYGSLKELNEICESLHINQAKVIYEGICKHNLNDFIGLANSQYYENKEPCEGIVIRTTEPISSKEMKLNRWSAKVLNENYNT